MFSKRKREKGDQGRPRRRQAVIYLRELEDGEASPVSGPSISTQRRICLDQAKDLNADVVGEFGDRAGVSTSHPGLARLLGRLDKKPRVDYLIVYSLDRLVPEREGAFLIGRALGSAGTILVSWAHGYDSAVKQKIAD